jgi:putative MATE family efflux protein
VNEKKELFESTPVPKALATLAIPTIISSLISMIYNLADTFFIGQTDDPYKVAATSVSFVLLFLMNALASLFGMGGGSLISRLLGRQEGPEARKVSAFSFYGTILVTLLYSVCVYIFMNPLLRFIGASDNTIGYAADYTFWVVVAGGIPSALSMTMAHMLRSTGYAKQASFGLGMGGVLNIVFDPLFMFVLLEPGQEVAGVAIATALASVCTTIYLLITILRLRNKTVLSLSPRMILPGMKYIGEIFSVGFPSAVATILACLSNITVNNLVSSYGDIPVAALGIVKKIDMLPMNVGMGLCQGMMPLVAYNYASGDYERMHSAAKWARIIGMTFAGLCIVAFQIFAEGTVRLFIKDEQTFTMGTTFLRICCLATPLMISNFQMNFTFQAMGKGRQSLILSACRQGLVNIPLLFLMNALFGLYGVVWTQLLSDGITLVLSFILYQKLLKSLRELEAESQHGGPALP